MRTLLARLSPVMLSSPPLCTMLHANSWRSSRTSRRGRTDDDRWSFMETSWEWERATWKGGTAESPCLEGTPACSVPSPTSNLVVVTLVEEDGPRSIGFWAVRATLGDLNPS